MPQAPPTAAAGLPQAGGVSIRDVVKSYPGSGRQAALKALDRVSLEIGAGEFVSIIGPSGCGKSTLLRLVAGLSDPDEGEVTVLGGSPAAAAAAKHLGLVPQSPALLPWRTVLENVELPFQVNRPGRRRHHRSTVPQAPGRELDPAELLSAVGLGEVLHRLPHELSGGMRQRVAIARAFVFGAPLLLMDEPFSALDELTRETLRHQLLDLWQSHQSTVVFVTHSVTEAVTLSDKVVVMTAQPGRVHKEIPVDLPRPRDSGIEVSELHRSIEAEVRSALQGGSPRAA